jgi:EAL domain-containing protein (putative c-di-GMP-specific phosphodiesterase class I)
VETKSQLQLLKEAGCNLVQGYYFSRPLPADEFERKLLGDKKG